MKIFCEFDRAHYYGAAEPRKPMEAEENRRILRTTMRQAAKERGGAAEYKATKGNRCDLNEAMHLIERQPMCLYIFDFYDFDLKASPEEQMITKLNGSNAQYAAD